MRKIIFNLSMAVDEVIHKCMKEFKKLGVEAKAMQDSKASEEDLAIIHKRMADIYRDLELFDYRVREMYPNMKELFDIFSGL